MRCWLLGPPVSKQPMACLPQHSQENRTASVWNCFTSQLPPASTLLYNSNYRGKQDSDVDADVRGDSDEDTYLTGGSDVGPDVREVLMGTLVIMVQA